MIVDMYDISKPQKRDSITYQSVIGIAAAVFNNSMRIPLLFMKNEILFGKHQEYRQPHSIPELTLEDIAPQWAARLEKV